MFGSDGHSGICAILYLSGHPSVAGRTFQLIAVLSNATGCRQARLLVRTRTFRRRRILDLHQPARFRRHADAARSILYGGLVRFSRLVPGCCGIPRSKVLFSYPSACHANALEPLGVGTGMDFHRIPLAAIGLFSNSVQPALRDGAFAWHPWCFVGVWSLCRTDRRGISREPVG